MSTTIASRTAQAPAANANTATQGMSRYKRLEKLGEGVYGAVYKAVDRHTGKFVAMKRVSCSYCSPSNANPRAQNSLNVDRCPPVAQVLAVNFQYLRFLRLNTSSTSYICYVYFQLHSNS